MRFVTDVEGSQTIKPDDYEVNGSRVYARARIRTYTRTDEATGEEQTGWLYDEVVLTMSEFDALKALDSAWVPVWSEAMRCAERRARYERMDPKVSAIRRLIDLGIDVEANQAKLQTIQTYCKAVTDTQSQEGYPLKVTYPDEPDV